MRGIRLPNGTTSIDVYDPVSDGNTQFNCLSLVEVNAPHSRTWAFAVDEPS